MELNDKWQSEWAKSTHITYMYYGDKYKGMKLYYPEKKDIKQEKKKATVWVSQKILKKHKHTPHEFQRTSCCQWQNIDLLV